MPRTKQNRKIKQSHNSLVETDSIIKYFEKQGNLKIHNIEADIDMRIRGLKNEVTAALTRLPSDIRKLTLGEILSLNSKEDQENNQSFNDVEKSFLSPPLSTIKHKKQNKRKTATSDDGYVTEAGARLSRATTVGNSKLRSRSSSRNRKTKLSQATQKGISKTSKDYFSQSKSSAKKFKTPALIKRRSNEFDPVTPKVKPNTPMSILRRPREGERVLSMQGSPLLVSAVVQERSANVNVPLHNGDIISLLPKDGLRLSLIPTLDEETVRQLETLKGHIEKVINSK